MSQSDLKNTLKPRQQLFDLDVLDAAQALGKRHGISELARVMGKSPNVLASKLNPDIDSHHLTMGEAIAITNLTNDNEILDIWAKSRGFVLVPVPESAVCEEEMLDLVLLCQATMGALMQTIATAREDGVIDVLEQACIERIGKEAALTVLSLIQATAANVRELTPVSQGAR